MTAYRVVGSLEEPEDDIVEVEFPLQKSQPHWRSTIPLKENIPGGDTQFDRSIVPACPRRE